MITLLWCLLGVWIVFVLFNLLLLFGSWLEHNPFDPKQKAKWIMVFFLLVMALTGPLLLIGLEVYNKKYPVIPDPS